jgi:hypothetical protein
VLDEQAAARLREEFGNSTFSSRQAIATLGQPAGSGFVRLSRMAKSGLIQRIEKGNYRIADNASKLNITPVTEWYRQSEIAKFGGYATSTYALSSNFMGHAPVSFLDIFLPAQAAVKLDNLYSGKLDNFRPVPSLHPYARAHSNLNKSADEIDFVRPPARAFLDQLLIINRGRRPVSLGYEIIPFLEELKAYWPRIISRSRIEGTLPLLTALVLYLRMISKRTDISDFADRVLPSINEAQLASPYPQVADLAGREEYDRVLKAILSKTGIILRADRQEALSVMRNI